MPPAVDTDRRPLLLIWEVTQACDLTCEHCRASAHPNRHPDELTTAEGKELLDQVASFGDRQLLVLSGGDPMKRPDLVELVEYGTERGLIVSLTPSGTENLDAEEIEALADAGLKRIALSLDGPDAESHDAFRGEAGSFEATMEAAEAARAAGIPLQINTTVCGSTVDDLPAIRDRVADLGAVLWSVFFLVPVGRGRILEQISPDRAEVVMSWLSEVADDAPFGVKTTEAPHYRRVKHQQAATGAANAATNDGRDGRAGSDPDGPPGGSGGPPGGSDGPPGGSGGPPGGSGGPPGGGRGDSNSGSGGGSRRKGVVAGDGFVFVSHTGEVYPSGFLPKSAGTVPEDDVVDVYRNADLFESLRDRDQLRGKCGACPFNAVCGGSRSRAYAATGDPLAADPLCAFVPDGYDGPLPWEGTSDGAPSPEAGD
ncbi:MAG: radical SAM protein [Haloarculaceae archaeon]